MNSFKKKKKKKKKTFWLFIILKKNCISILIFHIFFINFISNLKYSEISNYF